MSQSNQSDLARRMAVHTAKLRQLEGLRNKKEAERSVNEGELERLRAQAMTEFGTSDPDVLEARAREIEEDSVTKVNEFGAKLDSISANLAELGLTP